FFQQQNFLRVVDLAKFDLDHLIFRGLHRSSNEGGLDRQLAMAAIDQYAQLQAPGTAHAEQRIHGGAGGAAGIEHVVNQHYRLTGDGNFHLRLLHHGLRAESGRRKVVATEGYVEGADQHRFFFDALNNFRQPLRQRNSTAADADQSQIFDAIVLLENIMRQPDQG